MKKVTSYLILTVVAVAIFWWLVVRYLPEKKRERLEKFLVTKTEEIFMAMTPQERVAQLLHITVPGKALNPAAEKLLTRYKPGGVILFGVNLGSAEEIRQFTADMQLVVQRAGGLPLFISTDQEGGAVLRVREPVPEFPSAAALGQTENEAICQAVGFVTSYWLLSVGINVMFAPVLDINNNPENPVIHWRSFGSKPETVIQCALPFEKGARAGGALPVIKHFPGHGDTNIDSHLGLPVIEKDLAALRDFELRPFVQAIQNEAQALMTAHILYPKIDTRYPATLSPAIISDLLRDELAFQGLIFTDAMEMHAISKNYQQQRPASLAIRAGVDIILLTSHGEYLQKFYEQIKEDYLAGGFYTEQGDLLEQAVKRQIRLKLLRALFPENVYSENNEFLDELAETKKNRALKFHELQQKYPDLAWEASKAAIRSLKAGFQRRALPPQGETEFLVTNEQIRAHLKSLYAGRSINFNDGYISGRKSVKYVLADSYHQHELDILDNYAAQYPDVKFLILHYGRPYLKMPVSPNIELLFSFSPTKPSLKALTEAAFGQGEIPQVNLALQWRSGKK